MGFLAFLVIGGLTGLCALVFYPGDRKSKPRGKQFLVAATIGFMTALASSYAGLLLGLFQPGQMLEWVIVIAASSLVGSVYAAVSS